MTMMAKIFKMGRIQAVRLPEEFRFEATEVCIGKLGDMVFLYPKNKGWTLLRQALDEFTDDFMASRNQPRKAEHREPM